MADFAQAFYEVDAILTPATGITAPPIGKDAVASGESDLEKTDGNHALRCAFQYDRQSRYQLSDRLRSRRAADQHAGHRESLAGGASVSHRRPPREAELDRRKPALSFSLLE